MPRIQQLRRAPLQNSGPLRVAAYCRVSSDSADQLNSYASQIQFYTEYIGQHPDWELADIYTDEGLTGTKTEKRDDLKRLINDSRKGKVDRVIVKAVSRFARNVYDGLSLARLLKSYGTSVYFEEQNIDTAEMNDELILTMQSMEAQAESMTISQNMRWSCKRRMENGTYLASSTPYGYKLENGVYTIIQEQAEIVRYIFDSFLSGKGKMKIVEELSAMNAPKRFGHTKWHISTINCILNNTRYMGDAIFQKKFSTDDFPFRSKPNKGQKPMYYVEDTNPPIISPDVFAAAQQLQEQKKNNNPGVGNPRPFTKKIICACGRFYRYKQINAVSSWECRWHNLNAQNCPLPAIRESFIHDTFTLLVNKLTAYRVNILTPMISQLEQMQRRKGTAQSQIYEIDRKIAELNEQNHIIAKHRSKGFIDATEFAEQSGTVNSRVGALRAERRKLLAEDENDEMLDSLRTLDATLAEQKKVQTEFDGKLFAEIVTHITTVSNTELRFRLIGGLELTETISRTERRANA